MLAASHRTPTIRSRRSIHVASCWGLFYLGCSRGELSCFAISRFLERSKEGISEHGGATVDPGGAAKAFMVSHHHEKGEKGSTGPSFMSEGLEAVMERTFPPLPLFPPHR